MSDKYFAINIRVYLDKDEPTYIGEQSLYDLLSDFSCPRNPDVKYFLLHNAIKFTKKDQSVTYLVFDSESALLILPLYISDKGSSHPTVAETPQIP